MDERFTMRHQNIVEWGGVGSGGRNSGKSIAKDRHSAQLQNAERQGRS